MPIDLPQSNIALIPFRLNAISSAFSQEWATMLSCAAARKAGMMNKGESQADDF